jgi:hypothetical protein
MLAFVNFSAISSNAQINPANTINLTDDNENAIKLLSRIFDDEINDKDEKNDWKLIRALLKTHDALISNGLWH